MSTAPSGVPRATRASSPGWRDPRLWVGLAIVAASVVLGARLLGSADDTVAVWAVSADAAAGTELTADDVVVARVRFGDADEAAKYVAATDQWAPGTRLARDVGAGELLPRSALGATTDSDLAELPLDFLDSGVAATLHRGDRVDVFVTDAATDTAPDAAEADLALEGIAVLEVIRGSSSLGSAGGVQVIVGVDPAQRDALPRIVQAAADGRVYLVSRG